MNKSGKDGLLGNKIAAGVLTAGLVLWGANRIAHIVMPDESPEKPAIQIAALPSAAPAAATAPTGPESVLPLLASADIAKGQAFVQQQCSSCHTFTNGGANGVGPNLYGALGAPMFAHAGFTYSAAVKAKASGSWDFDKMNRWLYAPNDFAPGTGMSYAGIHNTQSRADVIAYLRTLSTRPLPLPTAEQIKAASAAPAAQHLLRLRHRRRIFPLCSPMRTRPRARHFSRSNVRPATPSPRARPTGWGRISMALSAPNPSRCRVLPIPTR